MKYLHITNHVGTIQHIENVFKYVNMEDTTLVNEKHTLQIYIDRNCANQVWDIYKDKISQYNCLVFTDTSMIARPFLQNIDKHNCFIIIYITNRFDWGIFVLNKYIKNEDGTYTTIVTDRYKNEYREYIDLYSSLSTHERVIFCSDNGYDQYYAKLHSINLALDTHINLMPDICSEIHLRKNNKYCIFDRGTKIDNYNMFLKLLNIDYDIFNDKYNRYRDCLHLCEYKGIIHFPYQVNIQSLWENIGHFIIYFIPSKRFISQLINEETWYYWEEKERPEHLEKSIELSEWYKDENACLFEYFDNWEELKVKTTTLTDEYFLQKKEIIRNFILKSNKDSLLKWKNIFSRIEQVN